MLPQERINHAIVELPDGAVYAFADEEDPLALLLRGRAAEQGVLFFSYQDFEIELFAPMGLCYIGLGSWPDMRLQRQIRTAALRMSGSSCEDAVFVFDETWQQDGGWQGKGGRAVPLLLANGYKVKHAAVDPRDLTILQRGSLLSSFRETEQLATA